MFKLSTRKILAINLGILGVFLGALLIPNATIRNYVWIGEVIIAILVSIGWLGWAKPRGQNLKIITIIIIAAALVYQVAVFLLFGLKCGFLTNGYVWNVQGIFGVFLPMILLIIGEEILRGQLVQKGENSKLAVIVTGVVLWLLEIIVVLPLYDLSRGGDWFALGFVVAGPAVLKNVLLTYIALVYDYRANIGYRLIMEMPAYLLPIIPDVGEYLPVMFQIGLMFILAIMLFGVNLQGWEKWEYLKKYRQKRAKRPATDGEQKLQRNFKWLCWVAMGTVVVAYVSLVSGMFKYYFLAIGSGSMEPNISRGDMILVEKSDQYGEMDVGEVLVYRHSNVTMVHRIKEIAEDNGSYTFRTQGDANDNEDVWTVKQSEVIGIAKGKMVAVGFPTLWLNELFNTK